MTEGLYTKEEIMAKAKQLANELTQTEEVDFFIRAEAQINQNTKIQGLIDEVKAKQKELVNLKHYKKTEAIKKTEAEIEDLHKKLMDIPIVQEFKRSQTEVNEVLQLVSSTISDTVTAHITSSKDKE
ncbi:LOW QUALITY PROTEIN: YmcA protein [Geomicrobium sp. JCM 19039]|nr:LOW QUALITY PROTEIN: YmcA protein [Geomicrobium sp. JCM 19039]